MKGLIHLYHGEGKGKTTAAVGLTVRASGTGFPVAFVQFMKGSESGEINVLKGLDNVKVFRSSKDFGFFRSMPQQAQEEITQVHNQILEQGIDWVKTGGVLVLDEITHALNFGLADEDRLKTYIENRPDGVEIVLTGRNPLNWLIEAADYITEMRKIKHPYDEGIAAREGIEL